MAVPAGGEKSVGVLRPDARFLRLGAGIDLDEEKRPARLQRGFLGQRLGKAFPIERVDRIEKRHGVSGLVRLQRADEVQFDPGVPGDERRPFRLGLLHAVLAEHALAGGDDRHDRISGEGL